MARPVVLIPTKIKQDVNAASGYLGSSSRYNEMNLKALFRLPENQEYLAEQLYSLITHPEFVRDRLVDSDRSPAKIRGLVSIFIRSQPKIRYMIQEMVEGYALPPPEDFRVLNPVQQLAQVNLEFLKETATVLIQSPQTLDASANRINPDTGEVEYAHADYDASSWSEGVWKPEDLFVNTTHNRKQGYWTPIEVNYTSGPDGKRGPGHRYQGDVYHGSRAGASMKPQTWDAQSSRGVMERMASRPTIPDEDDEPSPKFQNEQFPRWQAAGANRPYERSTVYNDQTMNGDQDRRVQPGRGYDMSRLMKKSSY